MSEPVLVFTHIPKAAGTTLVDIIRTEFGERHILNRHKLNEDVWTEQLRKLPGDVRAIVGHARYGVHREVSRPCRYFTVLRDPVERAISLYSYIRSTPAHVRHAEVMAGKFGLAEYARQKRDIQTKYIAGSAASGPDAIDDAELDRAKHHLESEYAAFGLAEEFVKSVLLFTRAFGWKLRGYRSRNITPDRIARTALAPAVLDEIRGANRLDIPLYDFARKLFAQRLAAQPPEFERELEALLHDNRAADETGGTRGSVSFLRRAIGLGQ